MLLSKEEKNKHLKFWAIFTLYSIVFDYKGKFSIMDVIGTLIVLLAYAVTYYQYYLWIFPKYLKKNNVKFLLSIFLTIILYFSLKMLNKFILNPKYYWDVPNNLWILNNLFLFVLVVSVSVGSYQNKLSILKIREQSKFEQINISHEINFFRNIFDSEFTQKFLSRFYLKMKTHSDGTSEAINIFSNMLKFSSSIKPQQMVSLPDEIKYIKEYIKLKEILTPGMKIRLNLNTSDIQNIFVYPRMFITLVENALKHGDCFNSTQPIEISLKINENQIEFTVLNVVLNVANKGETIILSTKKGLLNLKNSLEIYYKNKYTFNQIESKELYESKLFINIVP